MFSIDFRFKPDTNYRATLSPSELYLIENNDLYDIFGDSPLEITIPFTEFASITHNKGRELQFPWPDFVNYLINGHHRITSQKTGSLIAGYWLKENAPRSNENVELVYLFICDVDSKHDGKEYPLFEEMEKRFKQGGIGIYGSMVLGYTTFNHSPTQHRYRLILPLARAVLPTEYKALWEATNAELGGILDPATKDISRVHYLPICSIENLPFASWFTANDKSPCRMLNPEPLIVRGQQLLANKRLPKISQSAKPETPKNIANIKAMLGYISADCDYFIYRDIVWSILSTGWKCATQLAEDWCKTAPHEFNQDNFDKLVNSYKPDLDNPITLGTLVYHARQGGWRG
jgi:hypothetical protein